ncbi:MAG: hypothetical protein HY854_09330 [Burkholderiales bacterium]|nr:hypothetical protein [Burkholderiales bacterium]
MKLWMAAVLLAPLALLAAEKHDAEAVKKDVQRHRAMAAAHEQMAKCLESNKGHDTCQRQLQDACKGLGIGKYCGMKHEH